MAKTKIDESSSRPDNLMTPVVAATLAGVIYQSRLSNRQAKLNIPDQEVIADVVNIWRAVMDILGHPEK